MFEKGFGCFVGLRQLALIVCDMMEIHLSLVELGDWDGHIFLRNCNLSRRHDD